ncbi:MAG: hypothetical protein ACI9OJ_002716 [Myxococcota bacterium]|jgi:hypothetical protein
MHKKNIPVNLSSLKATANLTGMGKRSKDGAFVETRSPEAIAKVNAAFAIQAEQFNFQYDCRHCLHVETETNLCSMDYPNDHLWNAAPKRHALDPNGDLVFCKYFETV